MNSLLRKAKRREDVIYLIGLNKTQPTLHKCSENICPKKLVFLFVAVLENITYGLHWANPFHVVDIQVSVNINYWKYSVLWNSKINVTFFFFPREFKPCPLIALTQTIYVCDKHGLISISVYLFILFSSRVHFWGHPNRSDGPALLCWRIWEYLSSLSCSTKYQGHDTTTSPPM